ncbi:hypothetical protein F511_34606 [Dorcoceras hygrometricum]|uniref:Uncharacterized protein n=1 Tax=Dorcoceras hygrometricum TaxID=472368 RepID=A0A2Z7AMN8_9LAMI|nr:hypothetical protein F511_34606 [Dorcoceras hygrometricum]
MCAMLLSVDLEVLVTGYTKLATGCTKLATGCTKLATGLIFCLCATAEIIVVSGSLRLVHQLATGFIATAGSLKLSSGCTVACVWMYCSYLLVSLESCTCWFLAQNYLLNLSAKAKRCRINLFKRHRFAIAIFKYQLLPATDCDVTANFINVDPALALLFTTAECDDITADVIIADSRFLLALCLDPTADSSSCLLIMLTSLLMSSLLIQRLILLTSSADLYALALLLVFLHLLIMILSPMKSSSMVHLDVPAGSLLMFQLVHLPLLALAAGSYRSS